MIRFILVILACLLSTGAHAKGQFSDIPVLFDGRVQPMDSFARTQLKFFSGKETLDTLSATEWLIETLLSPQTAIKREIFLFNEKHISYEALIAKNDLPEDMQYKVISYGHLILSFSMLLPIQKSNGSTETYISLQSQNPNHSTLAALHALGRTSTIFKVIHINDNGDYVSPWTMMTQGLGSPQTAPQFKAWEQLVHAYNSQDKTTWDDAISVLAKPNPRFTLERLYSLVSPVSVAIGLYITTFLLGLAGVMLASSLVQRMSIYTGTLAIFTHIALLTIRVMVLERPPVGTLYESILFVSLVLGMSGFWFRKRHTSFYALTHFATGLTLLLSFYLKPDEGDFPLLEAVLNTNFWLATHVICITIGYGWCAFVSMIAHLELWRKKSVVTPAQLQQLVIVALIFTIVGTLLGGLWADQSWGRFWGWDPKENGALMIVLWIIWLIHGKMSGHIKPVYYLAGLSFLSVIVALSWFGVNLLSVGLHSYGFIEGITLGLFTFCFAEILIISGLIFRAKRQIS